MASKRNGSARTGPLRSGAILASIVPNEAKAVRGGDDDSNARYTEGGINVVALDRKGRGLQRARPERRLGSDLFPRVIPQPARLIPVGLIVTVVAVIAAVVAWIAFA
ncbi:hypothetical protein [Paraliomyxa miuraensis]|uniref:hypothetical protein n=1 Tax=Paraliomyxa miuraensis TaxID=376150 RepID=UPI0022559F22|nr:hypothetical protein [Paraliomyxa miuraensis]MCX4241632.1 hypothetical protein [Paraliomyxa miuraensis]